MARPRVKRRREMHDLQRTTPVYSEHRLDAKKKTRGNAGLTAIFPRKKGPPGVMAARPKGSNASGGGRSAAGI